MDSSSTTHAPHPGHVAHRNKQDLYKDPRSALTDIGKSYVDSPEIDGKDPAKTFSDNSKSESDDEALVTSTTEGEFAFSRSPPNDGHTLVSSAQRHQTGFLRHQCRPSGRVTSQAETAAATSTTSFDNDVDQSQTHTLGDKGRRGAIANDLAPPSVGTPLVKISEEGQGSLSKPAANLKSKENYNKSGKSRDQLLIQQSQSAQQNFQFGHLVDRERGSFNERRTSNQGQVSGEQQSKDERFRNEVRSMQMHTAPGVTGSPILSDISLIPLSPQSLGGAVQNPFAHSSPFDLYMNGMQSPTMSMLSQARNLSPRHSMQELEKLAYPYYNTHLQNNMAASGGSQAPTAAFPMPPPMSPIAYYQLMQQQRILAAAAAGNRAMAPDKHDDLSRFSSPLCRSRARKRPLSISPCFSDPNLDLTSMIRTSPNSLIPFVNGGLSHSRSSSVGSGGSYGHLAARGISPTFGYHTPMMTSPQHLQAHLLSHQMTSAFQSNMAAQRSLSLDQAQGSSMPNPFEQAAAMHRNMQPLVGASGQMKQEGRHGQYYTEHKGMTKLMNEQRIQHNNANNNNSSHNPVVSPGSQAPPNDDDGVYETNCDWENCSMEFDTQEQLVLHINNDHIHGDKKEFVCRWRSCAREQRPFKAQYMLVVHMRRHTGEKPHRCNYEGCTKAYSRLENLKTHLRSHTGEKPYVCEFPSCSKAFSNASDRAKHQNRTHSNEKPYACKIAGCTKRYTDPSSLRKHVKTVHGPEAHVTKRMRAQREREEKGGGVSVKQEPGLNKNKPKESDSSKSNCGTFSPNSHNHSNDSNAPHNMNPRSNQSSCTSGSDVSVTPQNSPHMTSQNNDSGVDVNVGANDGDSDPDIVVDEPPLPDSTSGGVQALSRSQHRTGFVPRMVNKKMQSLSIGGMHGPSDASVHDLINLEQHSPHTPVERMKLGYGKIGEPEVTSTTHQTKFHKQGVTILGGNAGLLPSRRQMALIANERRDSGTVSDVSRKSSMASINSRRSSQMSNAGINVAGSYDPISLDSSRRSSSKSNVQGSNYNGRNDMNSLDPAQLHQLRSKFSEVMGRPPPTPIDRDAYSKSQLTKWLEDSNEQLPDLPPQGYPNMMHPAPPKNMGPPQCVGDVRRGSDGAYVRQGRTPQPQHDVMGTSSRRASDPIRKASPQIDPRKLPNVQRYNSWNNIAPLPGIKGRQYNTSTSHYNGYPCNPSFQHVARQRSDSNGSFYSSESGYQSNGSTMQLNQQPHPQQQMQPPQQQVHPQQFNPAQFYPQGGVNEQVLMENLNADFAAQRGAMNPFAYDGNMAQPHQQLGPNHPQYNPHAGHTQPMYGPQGAQRSFQGHYPPNQPMGDPQQRHYSNNCNRMTQQNYPANSYQVPHGGAASQASFTPRPPPSGSVVSANRHRSARVRQANMTPQMPMTSSAHAMTSSEGTHSNQVNCTPDAQIPEGILQQEFFDCIPELKPDDLGDIATNENQPYIKMPADSTTGPDGDHAYRRDIDNDDAMSAATNTDVTLPPMSAFSSRMATPLMNKPYSNLNQHPASNMAINSMSSMLSALEEENKYLGMLPPQ